MHHGGIYPDDPIKFEEYTSLRANIECIGLFKTFNEAFERLVNKIITFTRINLKNIKLPFEKTEVIANELKDYDVSQKIRVCLFCKLYNS